MLIPLVTIASLLLPGVVAWLTPLIQQTFFSWLPDWFLLYEVDLFSSYQPGVILATMAVCLIVFSLGAIVEEIYFRGYLLPRMAYLGGWAPAANALLFAIYHFWQPYSLLTVFFWVLPIAYATWWKRNLVVGAVAHPLVNIITLSLFFLGGLKLG